MSEDKDVEDSLAQREEGTMSGYKWTQIGRITQVNVSIYKLRERRRDYYEEDGTNGVLCNEQLFPLPYSLV